MRGMFTLRLRRGAVERYREAHADVWPEMLRALRESGFENYSIFLDGHRAIGYFEAHDTTEAWRRLARRPAAREWKARNSAFVATPPGPDGPILLPEIFHLD